MEKQVGNLTKQVLDVVGKSKKSKESEPLLFSDINGRSLQIESPLLCMSFRRAIYLVSKTAYDNAMNSTSRHHDCAIESMPTKMQWSEMLQNVKRESADFDDDT